MISDLLKMKYHTRIDDQELVLRDDKSCDKILAANGNTYWFDVSMIFNHGKPAELQPLEKRPAGQPAG